MNVGNYGIIRWAAWYLSKGLGIDHVLGMVRDRWGHLGEGQARDLVSAARTSLFVAKDFMTAAPETTLSQMTGIEMPPNDMVSVTIAFGWRDASGRQQYASVKVPTQWGASKEEVLSDARTLFSALALDYDVVGVPTWSVVGGIWTPADTQL